MRSRVRQCGCDNVVSSTRGNIQYLAVTNTSTNTTLLCASEILRDRDAHMTVPVSRREITFDWQLWEALLYLYALHS